MKAMTGPRQVRSDDKAVPFRTTIHFRAANGATVSVTVSLPVTADETGRALEIAREAIAQVAAAQFDESESGSEHPAECGAGYWSWAMPEGWPRPQ
jgi:hypothetical protein